MTPEEAKEQVLKNLWEVANDGENRQRVSACRTIANIHGFLTPDKDEAEADQEALRKAVQDEMAKMPPLMRRVV